LSFWRVVLSFWRVVLSFWRVVLSFWRVVLSTFVMFYCFLIPCYIWGFSVFLIDPVICECVFGGIVS
jgi:hypothetical protein